MAANLFTGATNSNWGTSTNWSLGAVPTLNDGNIAKFDASSPNCTLNTTCVCNEVDFSGYINTLTLTNLLTVNGNVTLGSAMLFSGTERIVMTATASLKSNGVVFPNDIGFVGTITITALDDIVISGSNSSSSSTTMNGFSFTIAKSITGIFKGTTNFIMNGTGVIGAGTEVRGDFTINTGGTITQVGTFEIYNGTLSKTSGTLVVNTGSILYLRNNSKFNLSSTTFKKIIFADTTNTLLSDANCDEAVLGVTAINGLFNINVNTLLNVVTDCSGTASFVLQNSPTWSGAGILKNNLTIKSTATPTISGTVKYDTGTLTNEVGSIVTTTGSTLSIAASVTLNTNGINWNNVTITTGTATLNSLLTVNGTLSVGSAGNVTFAGTHGFTYNTFSCITAGRTINLTAGITYLGTNSLIVTGTSGSKVLFVSTSGTVKAIFNLQNGATQSVTNCNATRIDSSGGQTIYTSEGTLTDTINWGIGYGNFFLMF